MNANTYYCRLVTLFKTKRFNLYKLADEEPFICYRFVEEFLGCCPPRIAVTFYDDRPTCPHIAFAYCPEDRNAIVYERDETCVYTACHKAICKLNELCEDSPEVHGPFYVTIRPVAIPPDEDK